VKITRTLIYNRLLCLLKLSPLVPKLRRTSRSFFASDQPTDRLTMVKLSPFATHLSRPMAENAQEDSSDDETVTMATNRVKKDREMKELCIKWVFPLKHDGRQVLRCHWTMLSLMYDAFPDIIVIGNGSHNNITNCEEFETKNECKPKKTGGQRPTLPIAQRRQEL